MKKVMLTTGVIMALSIAVNSTNFLHSNPNGAPSARTGAPKATSGNETTCAASGCHGSSLNAGPHTVGITFPGNPTSFDPGVTYPVTVTVIGGTGSAAGCELVALSPARASTGTLIAGTGTKLMSLSGRSYLTHTNRNSKTWTFNWKAPTATVPDSVTFYVAAMETVGGAYHTYTSHKSLKKTVVTDVNPTLTSEGISIYPVPANDRIHVALSDVGGMQDVQILSMEGRSIVQQTLIAGVAATEIELPAGMKPGTYLLRIQNEKGVVVKRFSKF